MERFVHAAVVTATLFLTGCGGCSDAPPPQLPGNSGREGIDVGFPAGRDGGPADPERDAGFVDGGVRDGGFPDVGVTPDGGEIDSGVRDAGHSTPRDTGVALEDNDNDSIADSDEGFGAFDTDGDGLTDDRDEDSDNDGIPDRLEAGDFDLFTPPVDTDRDGVPDFRDTDSDNDGIPDSVETEQDVDGDGIGNFRDRDSDGDFLFDRIEMTVDTDGDGLGNYIDIDSDGDGIPDRTELLFDPDGDGLGAYIDIDSDGDGILDELEGLADPDTDAIPAFLDTDSDGDLIDDWIEGTNDADGDGVGNFLDADSDGDTLADATEGLVDSDNDGTPDYLDLDSDGDGVLDAIEAGDTNPGTPPADTDFDGTPDYLDLDSDSDNIPDAVEGAADPDGDGRHNAADIDSDGDFVLDIDEAGDADVLTAPVDSDGDSTPDFLDLDSDNDTIWDVNEGNVDSDGDGAVDRIDLDSDNDGVPDSVEAGDSDPATPPPDTDGDGAHDFRDIDSDGDGLADGAETGCPLSTNRVAADSDLDTYPDSAEVAFGSDPCSAVSGIDDFYFTLPPTNGPQAAPLDFTNTAIDRADFAINMDTTGSMGGEITNLRSSLSTLIIPGAQALVPNPGFSVSSFQDFPFEPFGVLAAGDMPFVLRSRVTTDSAAAQAAVNLLATHNGRDLPESGIEALFQIATGAGTVWGPGAQDRVDPFDASANRIVGVADGPIGGVGFRDDALPIVVHVTDAPTHFAEDYSADAPQVSSAGVDTARDALRSIGARVMTIASTTLPRPADPVTMEGIFEDICRRNVTRFYGRIESPTGTDVDWYLLNGALPGQMLTAEITASRVGSPLDAILGVYNGAGAQLAVNNDMAPGLHTDPRVNVALTGPGPFYVAVSSYNDTNFNSGGGITSGFYLLEVNSGPGVYTTPNVVCSDSDAGDTQGNATTLVLDSNASQPMSVSECVATCSAMVADDPMRLPYGIASQTGAVVPTCTWDQFGSGRPAGCAANECCTGIGGAGTPADASGQCPLAFEIASNGSGIGQAVVTGIESMVRFARFTITTRLRADPAELVASGLDTRCFIQDLVPVAGTPPNSCAPAPTIDDLLPPAGPDSFTNVVPGTHLTFDVTAENRVAGTSQPCVDATTEPQLFRAFIDVVADDVTVVDTRDVIIIVPPQPQSGS